MSSELVSKIALGSRQPSGPFWRGLTWGWLLLWLILRWIYVADDIIELSEDEAYQWVWSKYPDWSYYSKPPLIAWTHYLGTTLFGDSHFGVRFFSPLIAFFLGAGLRRFVAGFADDRTAFLFLLTLGASPLLAVGATLMTVDALNVFFWMLTVFAGWSLLTQSEEIAGTDNHRAAGFGTRWLAWGWMGLGLAGGQLCKFFLPFQILSFGLLFLWVPPTRRWLRHPGLWVAGCIGLLGSLPSFLWNRQNAGVTWVHLGERAGLDQPWAWTTRYLADFLGGLIGLLNPLFVALVVLGLWQWIRHRQFRPPKERVAWQPRDLLPRYLLAWCAPILLTYLIYAFRSRVYPNWVAPALLPFLLWGAWYWSQAEVGSRVIARRLWMLGMIIGLPVVLWLHNTDMIGISLPGNADPLRRVRAHRALAETVSEVRQEFLKEGKPVFLIADHYGRASLLNFYIEEAREALPDRRWVYVRTADGKPQNQYHVWPGYETRKGENAVYVQHVRRGLSYGIPGPLQQEFESVETLGVYDLNHRGRLYHQVELMLCRNKR